MNGASPAAWKQQACELYRLISLSCHSACCLLSIIEWVYHTSDNVSTVVLRQAGEHDGWVNPSDTVHLAEAKDQSLSKWTKLSPLPLLRMALHRENEICLYCLPQKINFIRPCADQ